MPRRRRVHPQQQVLDFESGRKEVRVEPAEEAVLLACDAFNAWRRNYRFAFLTALYKYAEDLRWSEAFRDAVHQECTRRSVRSRRARARRK